MKPKFIHNQSLPSKALNVIQYKEQTFMLPWHFHDYCELTLIVKGRGTRIIGNHFDTFSKDDLILLAEKTPHVWKSIPNKGNAKSDDYVESISIQFKESFAGNEILNLPEMVPMKKLFQRAAKGLVLKGSLREIVTSKLFEFLTHDQSGKIIILLDILNTIARSDEFETISDTEYICGNDKCDNKLNQIYNYILNNYDQEISLVNLAETVAMHPSSTGRFFKKYSGMNIKSYLNQVRVLNACSLLTSGDNSITEICFEVGFQSLSNFNRQFLKITGFTPRNFKKNYSDNME